MAYICAITISNKEYGGKNKMCIRDKTGILCKQFIYR